MEQGRNQKSGWLRRLIVAALMASLVLTMPCMGSLAGETVSDNSALGETDAKTGTDSVRVAEASGEKESVSENAGESDGKTVLPPREEGGTPTNPIHYCINDYGDGEDTTTWSYVYFGTYPQSEVTDNALKMAIDSAIAQGKGKAAGTEADSEGIDVWVGDKRYRRISRQDCNKGNVTNFGTGYRYFKWERIRWRVIRDEAQILFLAADTAIDCKNYDEVMVSREWESCTLRRWLNDSFYQNAFSSAEKKVIVPQDVLRKDNPDYNTEIGETAADKVYLLSTEEATDVEYGFCSDRNIRSQSRMLKTSAYAYARGTRRETAAGYEDNCKWWLRTLGYTKGNVEYADSDGHITEINGNDKSRGVVPVLGIRRASSLWSMTDDGSSGERENTDGGTGTDGKEAKVSIITLIGSSGKIAAGKKIKLTAEILPENAADKTLTWSSSNPGYASVSGDGTVTTKKAGAGKSVTITATAKDGSGVQAWYRIKVMKDAVKKIRITTFTKSVKAGKKLKLKTSVTTTGKDANKKLKWTSSNESYATVSTGGIVRTSKSGKGKTVTITAAATDGSGKKAKIKIKIK